ncbi:hypothetical protein [Yinghuangia seranimata]|uniref:hypothetical protein n=1 Tax=Yinghuangia seranimata TaxID=408067 RepID=UPI00248CDB2E|nr:hypothetical protein [Yinghuangia seranimata]MDI2128445.1 hypothetical protein [Yinghuangia seranimata]
MLRTLSRDRVAWASTPLLLLVVGLTMSQLAARARMLKVVANTSAGYLERVQDASRVARTASSPDAVAMYVRDELTAVLGLRGCRFEYGTLLGRPARLERDGSVVVGREAWDVDALGWPEDEVELRVFHKHRFVGRFMMLPTRGAVATLQARLVAVALADQVGASYDSPQTSGVKH